MLQQHDELTEYWTWLAYVWLINDWASYERWRAKVREHIDQAATNNEGDRGRQMAAEFTLSDEVEAEFFRGNPLQNDGGFYGELLARALGQIDRRELAAALLEDRSPFKVWTDAWCDGEMFPAGEVNCTAAARKCFTLCEMNSALTRHVCGDPEGFDLATHKIRSEAIRNDWPIRSAFDSESGSLFVIVTNAERSTTTIQLPDEYQEE